MKRIALLTCLVTLLFYGFSFSQTNKDAYLHIDYFDVESGNFSTFEEMVSTQWEPLFTSEMGADKIIGSYLYKVMYPGGQASDYNYVLVSTSMELNALIETQEKLTEQMVEKDDLREKILELCTHQYSELWKTEAGIVNDSGTKFSDYLVMNYMRVKPGKELEYLALENDIARPLHEERLKQGRMHSWRTYSILKPGGLNYDYNFATADYYNNVKNIESVFPNEIIKNVMPNANITETLNAMYTTRDIVKSELWKLVHVIGE